MRCVSDGQNLYSKPDRQVSHINLALSWLTLSSGYADAFYELHKFLSNQSFVSQIQVEGSEDSEFTGNFDVMLGPEKTLIHSKKKQGKGKASSTEERERIVAQIKLYLQDHK
jgi:hypothetical protein